jgi:hypothetical protein
MLKKQEKVSTEEAGSIINVMFSRLEPKDKQRILNFIDYFIIESLKVPKDQIPWLNSEKKKLDDCRHVLNLMRIGYAKLFNHMEKNFKNQVH